MGLSPSTLFHFTSKSSLKGILENNFLIKYCLEEIEHEERAVEIAIPMVSFCDIKISEITEHIEKYGSYGIGLSKKWATENGLNPVLYMNSKSHFSNNLISTIRKIINIDSLEIQNRYDLSNFLRYTKIYEGRLNRKGKLINNYRFADEREWRYVPLMGEPQIFKPFILKKNYNTTEKKRAENSKLSKERLFFNANDILYIIVKKESEINEILSYIRTVKGKNYTMDEVDRLTTRILSCERIINDF